VIAFLSCIPLPLTGLVGGAHDPFLLLLLIVSTNYSLHCFIGCIVFSASFEPHALFQQSTLHFFSLAVMHFEIASLL
jgi:hypothetical protein